MVDAELSVAIGATTIGVRAMALVAPDNPPTASSRIGLCAALTRKSIVIVASRVAAIGGPASNGITHIRGEYRERKRAGGNSITARSAVNPNRPSLQTVMIHRLSEIV